MKISELIERLKQIQDHEGDLEVRCCTYDGYPPEPVAVVHVYDDRSNACRQRAVMIHG